MAAFDGAAAALFTPGRNLPGGRAVRPASGTLDRTKEQAMASIPVGTHSARRLDSELPYLVCVRAPRGVAGAIDAASAAGINGVSVVGDGSL